MLSVLLVLASLSGGASPSACSVDPQVEAKVKSVALSDYGVLSSEQFNVHIRNTGPTTITLVEPGDGSDDGCRTPIVTWQIVLKEGVYKPPQLLRCGNVNPLRPEEIFDLKAGEAHVLGHWVPYVWLTQTGTYKLRLRYENDPTLKWSGIPLGEHDSNAIRRVRNSTACVATSNEVMVEVTAAPKQ